MLTQTYLGVSLGCNVPVRTCSFPCNCGLSAALLIIISRHGTNLAPHHHYTATWVDFKISTTARSEPCRPQNSMSEVQGYQYAYETGATPGCTIKRQLHQETDRLQPSSNSDQAQAFSFCSSKRTPQQVCRSTSTDNRPCAASVLGHKDSAPWQPKFQPSAGVACWRHAPWARYLSCRGSPLGCRLTMCPLLDTASLLHGSVHAVASGVPVFTIIISCPPVRPWLLACF